MAEQFANNAQSTLAAPCALLDTSITVLSAASFPTSGDFRLLIDNELMLCTDVAGVVFTVTRAIEGTTAAAHSLSAAVISPLTAGSLATLGGGGGAPSGPAGGALDGTYPNPSLAASVAGDGLTETSDVLSVNVDGSSIEISTDDLRVKALGITNAMLAGSIADGKLATSYTKSDGSRAFTGDQSMGSHNLTNVTDPSNAQDAATKAYVDALHIVVTALPSLGAAVANALYIVRNTGQPDFIWFKGKGAAGADAWLQYFPIGGTTGQVLHKLSNADYDVAWFDLPPPRDGYPSVSLSSTFDNRAEQSQAVAPSTSFTTSVA